MLSQPPKPPPQKKQPPFTQLDQLITSQLSQNLAPLSFKILGSSNGLILDTLFNERTFIFINATSLNNTLILDLILISLQYSKEKLVTKVPLLFSGSMIKQQNEKLSNIDKLQIQIKQSPKQEHILAVKIGIKNKQIPKNKDIISLLVLHADQFKIKKPDKVHLLKIKCKDTEIYDFIWHPMSNLTLVLLLSNQNLQIWNMNQQQFLKPTHTINLRILKTTNNITNPDIKFKKLAMLPHDLYLQEHQTSTNETKIDCNRYILFLMNAIGEMISIWPFLVPGVELTQEEYNQIVDETDTERQKQMVSEYLGNCQLEWIDQHSTCMIMTIPLGQTYFQIHQLSKNQPDSSTKSSSKLKNTIKISQSQQYYQLSIFPLLHGCILVIQVFHESHFKRNIIWVSIVSGKNQYGEKMSKNKVINPIVEIRNQLKNEQKDIRFISLDAKTNQSGLSKYKSLFYTQAGNLYKIDLSTIYTFMEDNNFDSLSSDDTFPITLIFKLYQNENILAMAAQQSLNIINFIRRTENKIKFETQLLGYLNTFQQIETISKLSNELLTKLNKLKTTQIQTKLVKQQNQPTKFSLPDDQIKRYQEKGVEQIKKDYKKYCDNIKYNIDESMNKLKNNFDVLKKKLKEFSNFKNKKCQITRLIEEAQSNNCIINQLLFCQQQNKQSKPSKQLQQIQLNINSLYNMLNTAKNKNLMLNSESQNQITKEIDLLFEKLGPARTKLEQVRKKKKLMENKY